MYSTIASMNAQGEPLLDPSVRLPAPATGARQEVRTVDNGDGAATTFYSDFAEAAGREDPSDI
ncbi:MAG TPA: hypothetical protein VHS99_08855 [Chloroflexota bacterium]|nr:hypothetical protein [Chloroflexota bacterium]